MRWTVWGSVLLGSVLGVAAAAAVAQQNGETATYWMSASTQSGLGAGGADQMRRGGFSAAMALMSGKLLDPNAVSRSLTLQIGSAKRPEGALTAEHDPPPALGLGPSLPLLPPEPVKASAAPEPRPDGPPPNFERPRGRLLIFWGCGPHVGPGQPVVFDAASLSAGAAPPRFESAVDVRPESPPDPYRWSAFARWPNPKSGGAPPAQASLQGRHLVRSNFAPEIGFTLGPDMDFMPPLGLRALGRDESGAVRFGWTPPPQATGYHLAFIGGQGGRTPGGEDGGQAVFWSSSAVQPGVMGAGLMDYLPPREVARLVAQRAVLRPEAQECLMPAEVARAAAGGFVTMIAYGPEAEFAAPPPARAGGRWTVRVRLKSSANLLLTPQGTGTGPAPGLRRPGLRDVLTGVLPIPH